MDVDGWLPSDLAQRGVCFYTVQMCTLCEMVIENFCGFNAILLFWRLMMWKPFQTTPTEMTHCSFLKPFIPMSVKYWKPFMVRIENLLINYCGPHGTMALWLVCLTQDWVVQIQALVGDIVLCSWASHFTLTVPLSSKVYKWVVANLILEVTLQWTSIPSRGE